MLNYWARPVEWGVEYIFHFSKTDWAEKQILQTAELIFCVAWYYSCWLLLTVVVATTKHWFLIFVCLPNCFMVCSATAVGILTPCINQILHVSPTYDITPLLNIYWADYFCRIFRIFFSFSVLLCEIFLQNFYFSSCKCVSNRISRLHTFVGGSLLKIEIVDFMLPIRSNFSFSLLQMMISLILLAVLSQNHTFSFH